MIRGHQGLTLLHPFHEFFGFVLGGLFCTEGDFNHVGETDLADGGEELFDRTHELFCCRRGDHGHDLFALFQVAEDVDQLGLFLNGAERTLGEAVSAENALVEVDFGEAVFILVDRTRRTGFFAGDGGFHNGVERADRYALAALDALGGVDRGNLIDDRDRTLGAAVHTGTGKAAAAVAGDHHAGGRAGGTGRFADAQRRFFGVAVFQIPFKSLFAVGGQRFCFIRFVVAGDTEQTHQTVFDDRAVMVNTAPA